MERLADALAFGGLLFFVGLWVGSLPGASARSRAKKMEELSRKQDGLIDRLHKYSDRLEQIVERQSRVIRGEGEAWKLG
jgi:hypothetical protein